jgi:hypothetical protein
VKKLKEIIHKHFKELKVIRIKFKTLKVGVMEVKYIPFRNDIYIDPIVKQFPKDVLEYLVIHELIHLKQLRKGGLYFVFMIALVSVFHKGWLRKIERETEKQCIELGFGRGLLNYFIFRKEHPELFEGKKNNDNLYLTKEEVKQLI